MRQSIVESLESRRLLTTDISFDASSGIVHIQGTAEADEVIVRTDVDSVVVDMRMSERSIQGVFGSEEVKSIHFVGKNGDDMFHNQTDLPSLAYGNNGNDTLIGGTGPDEFRGGPDHDELLGGEGDDDLHGDHGNDLLDGGSGDDQLRGWYDDDQIDGGPGNDYLSGYMGDDILRGGAGDDILRGHADDDQLFGGEGDDRLQGWHGADLLVGGPGNDYLSGWGGEDRILGGEGQDTLRGHAGRDVLIGGTGQDNLDGGSSDDILVDGSTSHDGNFVALEQILSAWNTDQDVRVRAAILYRGAEGVPALNLDTVHHDSQQDVFFDDGVGLDWYLFERTDEFHDMGPRV